MLILQIETATSVCSCALSLNGKTIGVKEINQPNIHIEKLTLLIRALLQESEHTFDELNAIAVSTGPGSYTGLRIGVSTAKGLCYALDIPLIAVNTLDAMAEGFLEKFLMVDQGSLICPMIDARRMEVYSATYDYRLKQVEGTAARIIDENSFKELGNKYKLLLFGDGANKFTQLFHNTNHVEIIEGFENSAAYLTKKAYQKAQNKEFENLAYFEPFYLKDFVPTQSRNKKGPFPVL